MDSVMHSDKVSSTASEGSKSSKPIMEKRRRARINASLAELKSLLLEVMKKEGARQNKMEKADILEMTVKHLRQLQRQQFSALASSDPAIINKYRLGFNECASEVSKFLGSQDSMDTEVRARLLNHLANVVVSTETTSSQNVAPQVQVQTNSTMSPTSGNNNIIQFTSAPISVQSSTPIQSVPTIICPPTTNGSCQPHIENKCNNFVNTNNGINLQVQTQYQTSEINNNTMTINAPVQNLVGGQQMQFTKVVNGLQVLPTKMSSGDMALIIPANLIQGGTIPNYVIPVLSSSNVTPCQTTVSPVNISQSTMSTIPPKEIMAPSSMMTFPINISANTSGINTDIIQMKPVFEHKSIDSNQTSPTLNHQLRPGSVNSYQNDSLQKLDNMWRPW